MWALFARFVWRDLLQNPLRTGLTVLGIALGVALVLAIQLANDTAVRQFRDGLNLVAGKASWELHPTWNTTLSDTVLEKLTPLARANIPYTPVLEQQVVLPGPTPQVITVLGREVFSGAAFETAAWTFAPGQDPVDFSDLFQSHTALVSSDLAATKHLKRGQTLAVLVGDRQVTLRVVGVLAPGVLQQAYGGQFVVMDIAAAQEALGLPGQLSRVSFAFTGAQAKAWVPRLQASLPRDVSLDTPAARSAQVEKMLRAFQTNLLALSFIALLVGMFLIYNTVAVSVIRRRVEIGTLRALGVGRLAVFVLFVLQAVVLGGSGALLGVGLGCWLAQMVVHAVSGTVQLLYTGQALASVVYSPIWLLAAWGVGVGVSVLATLFPAWEAASVMPAEATRRGGFEVKARGSVRIATGIALGLAAFTALALVQPPVAGYPLFGFMAAFSLILTGAFALPGLIRLVFPALSQLVYQLLGRDAQLAVLSLHAALGKTTVAVASLMIGIAMMVSLAVMIASFRQTVTDWVDQSMRADLWIEPAAKTVTKRAGFLSPQLLAQVQNLPGVTAVDPFLDVPITYAGQPANLGVGDVALLLRHGQLRWLTPTSSSQVLARLSRQPGVLLTESFARKHQLTAGDAVTLASPQGPVTLSVVAVYADYASEHGYIIVPRRWYEATFHDFRLNGLAVYTQAGVSSMKVKAALQQTVGPNTALTIRTNQELRQEVFRIFDQTFQITYALHAITIVVSVISVMNTLFALVLGDKREYGILKYLGLSRKQLMRMVFTQAAVLGVVGQAMGWLVGWGLSVVLIEVVNKQSFGWTIQMLWPWPYLLQSFGLVMLAAVVSAWWPARQAAKTPAPEAVRVE